MSSYQPKNAFPKNSIVSNPISPELMTPKVKKLEKSLYRAREKAEKAKEITDSINNHQLEICKLITEIEKRSAFLQIAKIAAIKIQKLFRGYLVRSQNDEEIIKIRRKTVYTCITDLKRSDQRNLTFTGKKTLWAGWVLTKYARRLLFLFKIKRITKAYLYFKMLKEEEGLKFIRIGLRTIYSKYLLSLEKFYIYRKTRLIEIHHNLALLVIKNFYRQSNLSFSLIMKRIKKYKRMLKMCKSSSMQSKGDFYSTKDQSTTRSEVFGADSIPDLKNGEDLGNILECASLTSTEYLEIEKTRRDKIQFGMIAYNISKNKEPVQVLPYLYQKDIIEEQSPSRNYTNMTNCLISRMISIQPKRQTPIKNLIPKRFSIDLPRITPSVQTPKKIKFDNENLPNFTRPTASSMAPRNSEEEYSQTPKTVSSYREHTTLFNQTFSGMQKLAELKQRSISNHRKSVLPDLHGTLPNVGFSSSAGRNSRVSKHYRAQTTFEMDKRPK